MTVFLCLCIFLPCYKYVIVFALLARSHKYASIFGWIFIIQIRYFCYAAAAKSLQSCLTLFDPIDSSPPGSPVPGILQARTLEWAAISFSNAWKWKVNVKSLIRVRLLATPWTAAYEAPPSIGFSRQEYWSGVPLPSLIHHAVMTILRLVNICHLI